MKLFTFLSILIFDFELSFFLKRFAKFFTFIFCFELGPKFHGSEKFFPFLKDNCSANNK